MINVTRDLASPESLRITPVIQAYIDACLEYEADQKLPKEDRTIAKPECSSSYRTDDVLEALHQVFLGKCYLTEKVFESVSEIEIDHFIPRSERPSLKYAWSNLYASDHKANISKPKISPPGGYLNPCNPEDDVETQILYSLSMDDTPHFRALDPQNQKAINTASLLNRLHKDLRKAIQDKHNAVLKMMAEWGAAQKTGDKQREFELEIALKEVLSRRSNFTMLIRSSYIVRRLPPEFFD